MTRAHARRTRRYRLDLRTRLGLIVAAVLVPFGLITTHLAVEQQIASLERYAERDAQGLLDLVDSSATNLVKAGDVSGLHDVLGGMRRHEGVVDAYVLGKGGDLLADGSDGETRRFQRPVLPHDLAARLADGPGDRAVRITHGDHLDAALPLTLGDERIGVVVLQYSLVEVRKDADAARRTGIGIDLLVTAVAVLAVILLAVRLTRALVRLTDAARVAADEDLPRVLAAVRQGEVVTPDLLPAPVAATGGREAAGLADALNAYRDVVTSMAGDLAGLLRERDARFKSAFDGSAVGMAMVDPSSSHPLNVNDALCRVLAHQRKDLLATPLRRLVHPGDRARYDAHLAALLRGSEPRGPLELRCLRGDGDPLWTMASMAVHRDEHGAVQTVFVQLVDVSARKHAEADLLRLAYHDPVTELPNRHYLLGSLERALVAARGRDNPMAVLLLDVDHFKVVNDSLGHDAGDVLLREVGARLHAAVRAGDTVARFGGDEFVVVAEAVCDDDDAVALALRIQRALDLPVVIEGRDVHVSASIGVAIFRGEGDARSLLRDADTAAYWAKARGRARHEVFDDELRHRAQARMQTEQDLRQALERDELVPYYQPIVSTSTGEVLGLEALVRWKHPTRGVLSPGAFLDVALETGLIIPIGRRVLECVCRDLAEWDALGLRAPWVSVNVDAQQLHLEGFTEAVASVLGMSGTEPERVHLELTENAFLDAASVHVTSRLRALGVRLAIDDFGTGYSSLHYLRQLPVDSLKIDRSFLEEVCTDSQAAAVVRAIVELSHAVDLTVVAEGVETPAQLAALAAMGCDAYQGFLHARPMPAGAVPAYLAAAAAAELADAAPALAAG